MLEIVEAASRLTAPAVSILFMVVVRVSIILGLAFVASQVLRRASPAARSLMWITALGAALLVLLLSLSGPLLRISVGGSGWVRRTATDAVLKLESVPITLGAQISPTHAGAAVSGSAAWPWRPTLQLACGLLWIAGAAVGIGRLLYGQLFVRNLVRRGAVTVQGGLILELCRELGIRRRTVRAVESARCSTPLTFGIARPLIILPRVIRRWDEIDRRSVLLHELHHVRRADSLSRAAAFAISSVLWFVPPIWAAYRRLCLEQEKACDAAVLASGVKRGSYAECLLATAKIPRGLAQEVGFGFLERRARSLKDRLGAILDKAPAMQRRGVLVAVTALVLVSMAGTGAMGRRPVNLFTAAQSGTPEQVRAALRDGAGPNSRTAGNGLTPLMVAARFNTDAEVTRELLRAGADPDVEGSFPSATALELAATYNSNPQVVAAILGGNAPGPGGRSWCLELASWKTPIASVISRLLNAGMDIDATDAEGRTSLMLAALHGNSAMVNMLLSFGADGRLRDKRGLTAGDMMDSKLRGTDVGDLLAAACR